MTERKKKLLILFTPVLIVLILDQVSKHWVRYSLELHRHEIIDGWLAFTYTQNPGMALGMDWLSTPVISVIAIVATIAIFLYIYMTLDRANIPYLVCMGLVLGGAIGNITDRLIMGVIEGYGGVLHGHVIDFIHVTVTINDTPLFPYIFNVADIAITTSIIAMLLFHRRILPGEAARRKRSDEDESTLTGREEGALTREKLQDVESYQDEGESERSLQNEDEEESGKSHQDEV